MKIFRHNRYKKLLGFVFCFGMFAAASAQDMVARQLPIDRKLKAVDSVTLSRAIKNKPYNYESNELYPSWNTTRAHCYSSAEVPEYYKIDLRGFSMPTTHRVVTSGFGYRPAFRRMHKGIDVKVYTGDEIYSAFNGKVRIVDYEPRGYGHYIVIRHDNGLETVYGHLSACLVEKGQIVKSGEVIGLGGNTGRSTGSHLHFETRLVGVPINPALIFDFANQDVTGDYFVFNRSDYDIKRYNNLAAAQEPEEPHEHSQTEDLTPQYHVVKSGETLRSIALRYGLSLRDLLDKNGISGTTIIRPGQILKY